MTKYKEYKSSLIYNGEGLEGHMNEQVRFGWQVVQVIRLNGNAHRYRVVYGR